MRVMAPSTASVVAGRLRKANQKLAASFRGRVDARTVLLHHLRQADLRPLVGREALVAGKAATAADDDVTIVVDTGINDGLYRQRCRTGTSCLLNCRKRELLAKRGNFLAHGQSTASSFGASSTSATRCATRSASISVKPRVVIAGEPMRMPEVTIGFCGSFGMPFLLTVMCACPAPASASLPVRFFGRRSTGRHGFRYGRRRCAGRAPRRAPWT